MNKSLQLLVLSSVILLAGCVSDQVISKEEMETQDRAANAVSVLLFDKDLDSEASYNIRKNGFVVIKFDQDVPENQYTEVVQLLRSNSDIKGLRAQQGGVEVCPLR